MSFSQWKTLKSIGRYRAAFNSMRSMSFEFSSSSMTKMDIACASSGLGMSFFISKKAEIKYRDFATLHDWIDVFAFPEKIFTQLKAPFTFSKKSFFGVHFASYNLPFQVRRPSVPKDTELFVTIFSMPALPQGTRAASMKTLRGTRPQLACFKTVWMHTVPACGLKVKIATQRLIWVVCSADRFGLRLRWKSQNVLFRWSILLTGKRRAPLCGLNDFGAVTHDRCPWFSMIPTAEAMKSLFACTDF